MRQPVDPTTLSKITNLAKAQDKPLTVSVAKKIKKQIDVDARPRPNPDKANAAIVAEQLDKEAANIQRRIAALSNKLQPVLGSVLNFTTRRRLADRWDRVVVEAQNLAAMLRERAVSQQEAAE